VVCLRTIVEIDDLHVTVVHGRELLDVELTGAHASEQPDPTPWLAGGELLMSDGLGIERTKRRQVDYVERLARKRLAALVLGLGGPLPYAEPPEGLVDGARRHDVPLLVVPVTTPFIAITQAVYHRMADERAAMSERILAAHAPLTSAAAGDAPLSELAAALGQSINGWAHVYDAAGRSVLNQPAPTAEIASAVSRHLARIVRNGLHTSAVESDSAFAYAIQPLGIDRVRGLLVYGRAGGGLGEQFIHSVASYAASLLSIEMERRHTLSVLERRPGAEVVRRLLAGVDGVRAGQLLASVGMKPDRVQVLSASSAAMTADDLADTIAAAVPGALLLTTETTVRAIVPVGSEASQELAVVLQDAHAGLGGPVRPQHCPASYRQAQQGQAESRRHGGGLVDAMGLGSVQVLLQLVAADGLTTFADAVLGAIESAPSGPSLIKSLRAFLTSGALIEQGSTVANVHRHTMRRHLRRIEEITGRNLDNARDRTELWLAFETRDVAATL
jgi:purine catabolism regulator